MPPSSIVDLSMLSMPSGFRIDAQAESDQAGWSVASAGDINGDGYADLVVGALGASNNGRGTSGSAYVLFGKASGFGTVDLANLGTQGFRIDGQAVANHAGYSVASAGDFNGDGYADLIVGAPGADNNGRVNSGSVYVVFGKASGFGNIDLASLGANGFRIDGQAAGDAAGESVAYAGDINGDGYADLIAGAQQADNNGRSQSGSAYVIFGKSSGFGNIDLSDLGLSGFRIDGQYVQDFAAGSVGSAGDFNGDGYADIFVVDRDTAYVFFGKATGFGAIDLANPAAADFRIDPAANHGSVYLAGPAGDFNGDGYADLILGAYASSNNGRLLSGSAYVVFGKASGFGNIDLDNLGTAGFRIDGQAHGDLAGYSVASAGDVNGDGYADLVLGAYEAGNNGRSFSGSAYLIFGKASDFQNIDLASLGSAGVRIDGEASGDRVGWSVASGDVDRDGFSDLIVGATRTDNNGRVDSGSAYVLFAQGTGGATKRGTTLADVMHGGTGNDTISGYGRNDRLFGWDGNDTLNGGDGNDNLSGGAGTDTLLGGDGDDVLTDGRSSGGNANTVDGGAGNDTASYAGITDRVVVAIGPGVGFVGGVLIDGLYSIENVIGGSGNDVVFGDAGANVLAGGLGDDDLRGAGGNDILNGEEGGDTLDAGAGNDTLNGGAGDDDLRAGTGTDTLIGGDGFDRLLSGGAGNTAIMDGGQGQDIYDVQSLTDQVSDSGTDGFNDLLWTNVSVTVGAGIEGIIAYGNAAVSITGASDNNFIFGNDADNVIDGAGGDDAVRAGLGNDLVYGGAGGDTLEGEDGNDTLNGGDGFDYLLGAAGNDVLDPGGGSYDQLVGGAGADTFRFRDRADVNLDSFQGVLRQIDDFNRTENDKIDLSGNGGTFSLVDSHTLGTGYEMVLTYYAGPNLTLAQVYLDGDANADLTLRIWNSGFAGPLQASDFLLG